MRQDYLFTSESVAKGHPDKVADQISDAILDACLREDPFSRVAVETLITDNFMVLAGEISSSAQVDYEAVAKMTLLEIGYGGEGSGFDLAKADIITKIHTQSPDISRGVLKKGELSLGAGDQGLMFGYAVNETPELMPLPIELAHELMCKLNSRRDEYPFLRPDGKTQVTVHYDREGKPLSLKTILLSVQHSPDIVQDQLQECMLKFIKESLPSHLIDEDTRFLINPTGRFVTGGPEGDTGLTGRKIIVDTYGGRAHHGGGAFSGKDATKVDRSGAYAARYIAKHIVAAGITPECEIQIAYAIGIAEPVSLRINTFGHCNKEKSLEQLIRKSFPVAPSHIIDNFQLRQPIYQKTAFGGHFGRSQFPWEKLDRLHLF